MVEETRKDAESIRVVDRRRFTDEGERRKDVAEAPSGPEAPRVIEPPPAAKAEGAKPDPAPAASSGESQASASERPASARRGLPRDYKMDFETLVLSLSTSAMYQMGLLEDPERGRIPADLDAARQTLDMLDVIEEKTRGNLSEREHKLLEQVLYELRMYFVQLSGQKAPSPPSVKP